jgi:hypothetical protein
LRGIIGATCAPQVFQFSLLNLRRGVEGFAAMRGVRHGREDKQLQHERDLELAREECEFARERAAAGLRAASEQAANGSLDSALKRAAAALGDLEDARRACERWNNLHPID